VHDGYIAMGIRRLFRKFSKMYKFQDSQSVRTGLHYLDTFTTNRIKRSSRVFRVIFRGVHIISKSNYYLCIYVYVCLYVRPSFLPSAWNNSSPHWMDVDEN